MVHQSVAASLPVQVEKLKAEAASQEAEVARLHGTTVQQLYLQDLDAFLEAYQAWEAEETANSGLHLQARPNHTHCIFRAG